MPGAIACFFHALAFFTRLPNPSWVVYSPQLQRQAACFAPLIGILVGAFAALMLVIVDLFLPMAPAIVFSIIATLWFTGALHEDGLADTCDGFGGGWSAEQILSIMKDSRTGAFGVAGLSSALLLKFILLVEIANAQISLPIFAVILITGHSFSRLAAVSLIYSHVYINFSNGSKAQDMTTGMHTNEFIFASVCGLLPVAALGVFEPVAAILAVVVVIVLRMILAHFFTARLGGYTGDCLGTVQQASELGCYTAVCAVLHA